jgi:hypothetical protein
MPNGFSLLTATVRCYKRGRIPADMGRTGLDSGNANYA